MVSQDRIYARLLVLVVGIAVQMLSSQTMAESRSEVLERIRPIGQVNIEGQAAPAIPVQPSPETSAATTEPVAKTEGEPAPEVAATPQPAPAPTPSASKGAALYAAKGCSACHGADGKRTTISTYPKLAGQSPEYAYNQMKDIKSGARSNGQAIVMKGIIATVSDEEMRIIADWLGGL